MSKKNSNLFGWYLKYQNTAEFKNSAGLQFFPGFVYLFRFENDVYKIGRTTNLERRRVFYAVAYPFEVEFAHTIECDDHIKAEELLHRRYEASRIRGEWFYLKPEDVRYICSIERYTNGKFRLK